jgi:hypothetical protein
VLLSEVTAVLGSKSEETRTKALVVLKNVLAKVQRLIGLIDSKNLTKATLLDRHQYETDSRYVRAEIRTRIANLYIPFVSVICENIHRFRANSKGPESAAFSATEKRLILICVLFVIKYVDRSLLLRWLSKDNIVQYVVFVDITIACLQAFKVCWSTTVTDL